MINEVRVVLNKPENLKMLISHIKRSVKQMSDSIESHFLKEYSIEKRQDTLSKLKEARKNESLMKLTPETFRLAVEEIYGVELDRKHTPSNLDYYIELAEVSLKRDLKTCRDKIKYQKEKTLSNVSIIADIPEMRKYFDDTTTVFKYLQELAKEIPEIKTQVNLSVKLMPDDLSINEPLPVLLNEQEADDLADLISLVRENKLTPSGDVGIREYVADTDTSVEQIERANEFVKKVAAEIKSKNLSPFETVVYVHHFCSEFGYTNRGGDKRYGSRLLKNVISSGNINCIGFSTMFKAILDEIGNKNISTSFNHGICPYDNDYIYGAHGNVLVRIKDDEYQIDGEYICDVSLNNAREDFGGNLCCCLMPVEDLENIEDFEYFYSDTYPRKSFYDEDLKPTDFSRTTTNIDKLVDEHVEFIHSHNHEPIEIKKFENALRAIGAKSGMDEKATEKFVDDLMRRSLNAAAKLYLPSAVNSFYGLARDLDVEIICFDDMDENIEETRQITGRRNKARIEKYVEPSQD